MCKGGAMQMEENSIRNGGGGWELQNLYSLGKMLYKTLIDILNFQLME